MADKKLFYQLEADDYEVISVNLDELYAWIRNSCEDIARENKSEVLEKDMPTYVITPVWMTDEEYNQLPEAE